MKKYVLFMVIFALVSTSFADDTHKVRLYFGVHGNTSQSSMSNEGQTIDNGNIKSNPNLSITAGVEGNTEKYENIRLLIGGELFFDYINKTMVQGNQTWTSMGIWTEYYLMAGQPIYKTNFLTGLRGKIGLNLFNLIDLYGHTGLLYWDRDLYVRINDDPKWDLYIDGDKLLANWKIMPFVGLGTTVHITDHWAINASYMKVMRSKIQGVWRDSQGVLYNYNQGNFNIGIDVLTIGIVYYF